VRFITQEPQKGDFPFFICHFSFAIAAHEPVEFERARFEKKVMVSMKNGK
jgi:hypothetical protein